VEVGIDVSEYCQALQIGVSKITGTGIRHTNTGIDPAAEDNPPAIRVPVLCVMYPSMGINFCVFLVLEGDRARVIPALLKSVRLFVMSDIQPSLASV
jgi:hypothetical protein